MHAPAKNSPSAVFQAARLPTTMIATKLRTDCLSGSKVARDIIHKFAPRQAISRNFRPRRDPGHEELGTGLLATPNQQQTRISMPFLREKTGRWSPEKIAACVIVLAPMLWLLVRAWTGDLGVGLPEREPGPGVGLAGRPIHDALLYTGRWTVRFILLALAITPARRLFNWPKLLNARRTIGVAAASYALVHFCLYVTDQKFRLDVVAAEIVLRVYLTIGFAALVGLMALASTSTDAAVRRLGQRWNTLHRLVYLVGVLAIVHFAMQKKLDIYEPTLMMGFLFWLFGWRIMHRWRRDAGFTSLIVLAFAAALTTAAFEAGWYGTLTGISATRVLEVNLMFDVSIRPMWWVLAAGIAIALASAGTHWLWPREAARGRLRPAE